MPLITSIDPDVQPDWEAHEEEEFYRVLDLMRDSFLLDLKMFCYRHDADAASTKHSGQYCVTCNQAEMSILVSVEFDINKHGECHGEEYIISLDGRKETYTQTFAGLCAILEAFFAFAKMKEEHREIILKLTRQ